MKPTYLRRPVWKMILSPALFFFLVGIVVIGGSAVYMVNALRAHGFPLFLCVATIAMFGLTGLILYGFFVNLCELSTQITMTDEGITVRRFGRRLLFLPWTDLAEAGITLEMGPDRNRCVYFSNRHLDEYERCCVSFLVPSKGTIFSTTFDWFDKSGIIWIRCSQLENETLLRKLCPLPLPALNSCRDMYTLLSYKRDRLPGGSWSDPSPVISHTDDLRDKYNYYEWVAFLEEKRKQKRLYQSSKQESSSKTTDDYVE